MAKVGLLGGGETSTKAFKQSVSEASSSLLFLFTHSHTSSSPSFSSFFSSSCCIVSKKTKEKRTVFAKSEELLISPPTYITHHPLSLISIVFSHLHRSSVSLSGRCRSDG